MSWFRRQREATNQQVAASGAGGWAVDDLDQEAGYHRVGGGPGRPVPDITLEKARTNSVAGYRTNPMARAIIDTYVAFCVGDSGVSLEVADPLVRQVAEAHWNDPKVSLGTRQELELRSHLLYGESCYEALVGAVTGVTRWSPIDPSRVREVRIGTGNAWWPTELVIGARGADMVAKQIITADDTTELLTGEVLWWISGQTLNTDLRGLPFLTPVLDWLDSYDQVLSNLIDRTALARYLVWDVELKGSDQTAIDAWVAARGGRHAPRSGTIEVHNESVTWKPQSAPSGVAEDATTAGSVLTVVAGGAGLAKTWLADPEDANKATSVSMAEPIRRRVGAVQNLWIARQTEMVRFAVDQAVAAGRLPATVTLDTEAGPVTKRAAETVQVRGPQIAASDAQITARVMVQLSTALETMVANRFMTPEAAQVAAQKAWEDYLGVPYRPELGRPDTNVDDVATAVDTAPTTDRLAALAALLEETPA
ncbi:MAG: hypothetical protein R2749_29560 [Acidimicrobiales bacterium]